MHLVPLAVVLVLALPLVISLAAHDAWLGLPGSFLARTSDACTSTALCPSTVVIGTSNTPDPLAVPFDMTSLSDEGQGIPVAELQVEPNRRSDSGLTDYGSSQHALRSTEDPDGQPIVIGVGGTSISGANTETVWNRGTGIGGGGISLNAAMPRFQHAVSLDRKAYGAQLTSLFREVTDIGLGTLEVAGLASAICRRAA